MTKLFILEGEGTFGQIQPASSDNWKAPTRIWIFSKTDVFPLCFCHPPTHVCPLRKRIFERDLQIIDFWKRRLIALVWTRKNGDFHDAEVHDTKENAYHVGIEKCFWSIMCRRASTIRKCYGADANFCTYEEENLRFPKYPDTCGPALSEL